MHKSEDMFCSHRQCLDPDSIRLQSECRDNLKHLLKQCLSESETKSFNKVEDIATRIYKVICEMDHDKMRSNLMIVAQTF